MEERRSLKSILQHIREMGIDEVVFDSKEDKDTIEIDKMIKEIEEKEEDK